MPIRTNGTTYLLSCFVDMFGLTGSIVIVKISYTPVLLAPEGSATASALLVRSCGAGRVVWKHPVQPQAHSRTPFYKVAVGDLGSTLSLLARLRLHRITQMILKLAYGR
jgi:hypothetical protein